MSLLMLLCPLGMAAMGGVAWVLTRLPGRTPSGLRGWFGRSCLPMSVKQPAEAEANAERENEVAQRV